MVLFHGHDRTTVIYVTVAVHIQPTGNLQISGNIRLREASCRNDFMLKKSYLMSTSDVYKLGKPKAMGRSILCHSKDGERHRNCV